MLGAQDAPEAAWRLNRLIASGGMVNLFGAAARVGLLFFQAIVIVRLGGVATLGSYGVALVYVATLASVSELGMSRSLNLRVAALPAPRQHPLTRAYVFAALAVATAGGLLCAGVMLLSLGFLHDRGTVGPEFTRMLAVLAAAIPLTAVLNVVLSLPQAFKVMRHRVYLQSILQPALDLGGTVLFLWLGFGTTGLAVSCVLSLLISVAIGLVWIRPFLPPSPRYGGLQWTAIASLLRFGLPAMGGEMVVILTPRIAVIVLASLASSREVGVFVVVARIASVFPVAMNALNMILAPIVAEAHGRGETALLQPTFKRVSAWLMIVTLPLVALCLLYPEVPLAAFGGSLIDGRTPLYILTLAAFINVVTGPVSCLTLMTGRSWDFVRAALLGLGGALAGSLFLVGPWGLAGAAIAQGAASAATNGVLTALLFWRHRLAAFSRRQGAVLLVGGVAWGAASLAGAYLFVGRDPRQAAAIGFAVFLTAYVTVGVGAGLFSDLLRISRDGIGRLRVSRAETQRAPVGALREAAPSKPGGAADLVKLGSSE